MSPHTFDWESWRREVRRDRIDTREGRPEEEHRRRNRELDAHLEAGFGALGRAMVAFCWPFRHEPEPRFAVRRWRDAGAGAALPVVVAPRTPLLFRQWWPGVEMANGVYDIPYPVDSPAVLPTAALVPCVGFDPEGYRLGYGGGYFDRTLAAMSFIPITVGLAFELNRLRTIHPQPHDIPFDFFVTEAGIEARTDGRLQKVEPADADARVRALQVERGLV